MLNKIFNVNNPFWQSMNTIFDLFILNTLWLICSIPLVTIGPATAALYYTLIQRARREERAKLSQDFFYSFKGNLRQGILLGVPLTLVGAFLAFDIWLCRRSGTGIYTFFMVFFAIVFVFWAFTALYAFPVLSKFDRTNRQILIWAFTLSIKNLTMTLTMLFVLAAGLWLCHLLPGLIFIIFGIIAQFNANIFAVIFKPFLPKPFWKEEEEAEGAGQEGAHGSQGSSAGSSADSAHVPEGSPYADFDEAAFYGEDPEEVKKLLKEMEQKD